MKKKRKAIGGIMERDVGSVGIIRGPRGVFRVA